ncbi:TonB-dependent siderophore receptor [Methylobacterium gnaphalii]|uniref:Ligand-gated channel n=1 Tax=Methylobacterium gnaphalii TaxID=1010610 RepID=A0A512JNV8_9HYPH|nr:TonB-dependent siderophore receptor [Methylobacterium gnaphalii]GEP11641.1 ligand-gated channel [Methylobacterium gnaphalii]GJD69557.1 Ferrichrome outer membrane transporter/phage receptor [Methylobacterium gnaphalii]GLS49096.1 ligand-gated channel [Methylobacterium gnaphalii]
MIQPSHILLFSVSMLAFVHAGQAVAQQSVQLDQVEVVGDGSGSGADGSSGAPGIVATRGYTGIGGRTATKTDTPILETPQAISTVTNRQLEDRQPQSLVEAVAYVPGVNTGQFGFDPRYDAFKIRGIDVTYTGVFRDGLRQINSPNGLFRLEPYGLEAITILRGPAASIYGASSSGGIVDLISKRPTFVPLREINLSTGSYDRIQGAFDLSGPIEGNPTMAYRLTGLVRSSGTQIDAIADDRVFIAPAFTWKPDEDTKLTLLAEYMNSKTGGTAAYVNNYDPVTFTSIGATRVFAGDKRFNDFIQDQGRIGYELEQRLSDAIVLHSRFRFSGLSTNQEYVSSTFPGLVLESNSGIVADNYFESRFRTGFAEHQLITGVDVTSLDYTSRQGFGTQPFTSTFTYVPPITTRDRQNLTEVGLYAQDQIKVDAWRLTLGLRHDWLDTTFTSGAVGSPSSTFTRQDGQTTGRAALSYVTPFGVVPYVSFATSFVPNPGTVLNGAAGSGSLAAPTTGQQGEIGVKYEIPAYNALVSAALFDIDQKNGVVFEASSGVNEQIQLDLRSRGFEIEGTASPLPGLNLTASYSYNDVEITKLTAATVGNTLNASPYHTASIYADYTIQGGTFDRFGFGAGVRYVGSSFGDNVHTPALNNAPGTFVDAALHYELGALDPRFEGVRLQVNATNLLDDVQQVCTSGYCYFNQGRRIIANLRYRF